MTVSLNDTLRSNRADEIAAFAGSNAKLRVYTAGYAALLYECICAATLAPAAVAGVLTANPIADATATGSGRAAVASLYKSDGTTMVMNGLTVGTVGTNVVITNPDITAGDTVITSGLVITEGNP